MTSVPHDASHQQFNRWAHSSSFNISSRKLYLAWQTFPFLRQTFHSYGLLCLILSRKKKKNPNVDPWSICSLFTSRSLQSLDKSFQIRQTEDTDLLLDHSWIIIRAAGQSVLLWIDCSVFWKKNQYIPPGFKNVNNLKQDHPECFISPLNIAVTHTHLIVLAGFLEGSTLWSHELKQKIKK